MAKAILFAAAVLVLAASIAFGDDTVPSSEGLGTCVVPSSENLYSRKECAKDCYQQFCSCIGNEWQYNRNAIVDSTEPQDFRNIGCVNSFWGVCDLLVSCTAELIECTNTRAGAGCKGVLNMNILGFAANGSYPLSAPHHASCAYSGCDIFNRTNANYITGRRCTWSAGRRSRVCVNPVEWRGTLILGASVYSLRYDSAYSASLTSAVHADLNRLFSEAVTVQSVTGQASLRVEFTVNSTAGSAALYAEVAAGRAGSGWLFSVTNFFRGAVRLDYLGPRIRSTSSENCFSFPRTIPYVTMSGVPLRMTLVGTNTSECIHSNWNPQLTVRLTRKTNAGENLYYTYYEWSYRHLVDDTRNFMAGQVDFSSGLESDALVTAHCGANDTDFNVIIQSNVMSYRVGEVHCVHKYPQQVTSAPNGIVAWISSTSPLALARTLLATWVNFGAGTRLNITGGVLGTLVHEQFQTFSDFQSRANLYVDGTDNMFVAPTTCNNVPNSTRLFYDGTGDLGTRDLLIVGGTYHNASCSGSGGTAGISRLRTVTDIIVTGDVDPVTVSSPATRTFTLGYPNSSPISWRKTLEAYDAYRFEREPTRCTGAIQTSPSRISVDQMSEDVVRFNGVCGVTECCVGEYCSSQIFANGRGCTLPMVGQGGQWYLVLKRGATSVSTSTLVTVSWWSRIHQYSTWSRVQEIGNDAFRIMVHKYDKNPYCYQLRCLNSISPSDLHISNMPVWSPTTQCASQTYNPWANYYRYAYYWYTVYGWVRYDWGYLYLTFQRPASFPGACSAIVLNIVENYEMLLPPYLPYSPTSPSASIPAAELAQGSIINTEIRPVSLSANSGEIVQWCRAWAQNDVMDTEVAARITQANDCFQCPASMNGVLPRFFWQVWGWGQWWFNYYYDEQGTTDETCFRTWGPWQSALNWERRCCYTRSTGQLITGYPSRLKASTGWGVWPKYELEKIFGSITETNPNTVCCNSARSNPASCKFYRNRRPTGSGTTTPFSRPPGCTRGWQVPPPAGWGRGDPYCTTFDGTGFECNFWGEALWTSCQGWKVHVSAVPVSAGASATIINGVAIVEGNETIVITRDPISGDANTTLNGDEVANDVTSSIFSITFERNSLNRSVVRIISVSGHDASVDAQENFFAVSVSPNRSCIGSCHGLMGNCDGVGSNDLVNRAGNVTLPINSSGIEIFNKIVKSFVITNASESLFPVVISENGTATTTVAPANAANFVPTFISNETLASCPSLCNNEPGCCLDAVVAGVSFANTTAATNVIIRAVNEGTVPLTGYNWPPEIFTNPRIEALQGLPISTTVAVTDDDGVANFTIDACTATDVTCTTVSSTSRTISMTATRNFTILVAAVDTRGRIATASIQIIVRPPVAAPDTPSVAFTFTVNGQGAWTASDFYAVRQEVLADLATIVNRHHGYSTSRRQNTNTTPTVPFTTQEDFIFRSASDVVNDPTAKVRASVFVLGDTDADATARSDALVAQTSLSLPTAEAALARMFPGSTLGAASVGTTPVVSPSSPSACSSASCAAPVAVAVVVVVALIVVALVLIMRSRSNKNKVTKVSDSSPDAFDSQEQAPASKPQADV